MEMSALRWIVPILVAALQLSFGCESDSGSSATVDPGPAPEHDHESQLTTDGAGNWVAVWKSDGSLGGTIGQDLDILVARSADDGATWTDPSALNTNAASDTGDDFLPQVATDGAGNWVAVWLSEDSLGGTIGTDVDILVARSADAGATWTDPAHLNSNAPFDAQGDWYPKVTTDGAGNWVAVWNSDQAGPPAPIGPWNCSQGPDQDVLLARSTDAGATWTAPRALNTTARCTPPARNRQPADGTAQVKTDGAGNWVAVWRSFNTLGGTIAVDPDIQVARSTDAGATWTPPAALSTDAAPAWPDEWWPEVASDGAGSWVAVWQAEDCDSRDACDEFVTDHDILVARSTDAGATWAPPAALNTNAATDSAFDNMPRVAGDGAGNWVAVWESDDSLGDTIGTDRDILFSRSSDDGATWTASAPLNTNAATDSGEDGLPQVTTDGAGNWLAVWNSTDSLGDTIGEDADILVARSMDAGATWTPPVALNTNAASDIGSWFSGVE
jgi:Neuraminidase (sialidase)